MRKGFFHPLGTINLPQKLSEEKLLRYYWFLRHSTSTVNRRNAANRIIMAHLRLGSSIVARYAFNYSKITDDLMSAMIESLTKGVSLIGLGCLDQHQGNPNVTGYLVVAMEGSIRRYIRQEKRRNRIVRNSSKNWDKDTGVDLYEILQKSIRTDAERRVMALRIEGYNDAEIGRSLDLSRERIRQIRTQVGIRFKENCND